MNFSSLLFLYIFLPLTLLVYFLMPDVRRKNLVLIVVSFLLYAMGRPLNVFLLGGLSYLNYRLSLVIRPSRPRALYLPVAINLGVFFVFRYLGPILGILGLAEQKVPQMPIGLPFYFLTVVSYFLDLYRGKIRAEKDLVSFLTYVTMFPKLAQGPIVGYGQIGRQLTGRRINTRPIFEGAVRFITGLSKKVLLADYCARTIADLAGGPDQTLVGAWLCAVLYMYRIYFDFSGCCDMAIGLGRVFGFRFPENFNHPYDVVSVTEFTRKWNLTLGSFVKEYVYIPLGGNRNGQVRQVMNCLIAWIIVGIWHGAGFNYLVWVLYLFVFVMVERLLESQLVDLPGALRHLLTMLVVLFGWVFFAHPDLMDLGVALKGMLGFGGFATPGLGRKVLNSLPLILMCMASSGSVPKQLTIFWCNLCNMGGKKRKDDRILATRVVYVASVFVYACVLLWLCTVSLAGYGTVSSIFGGI